MIPAYSHNRKDQQRRINRQSAEQPNTIIMEQQHRFGSGKLARSKVILEDQHDDRHDLESSSVVSPQSSCWLACSMPPSTISSLPSFSSIFSSHPVSACVSHHNRPKKWTASPLLPPLRHLILVILLVVFFVPIFGMCDFCVCFVLAFVFSHLSMPKYPAFVCMCITLFHPSCLTSWPIAQSNWIDYTLAHQAVHCIICLSIIACFHNSKLID